MLPLAPLVKQSSVTLQVRFWSILGCLPLLGVQAQDKVNVAAMHASKAPEVTLVDDGSQGKIRVCYGEPHLLMCDQIWIIEEFNREIYPTEFFGHLYSGDCFLIVYTYMSKNSEKDIIYFWQGREQPLYACHLFFYYSPFVLERKRELCLPYKRAFCWKPKTRNHSNSCCSTDGTTSFPFNLQRTFDYSQSKHWILYST